MKRNIEFQFTSFSIGFEFSCEESFRQYLHLLAKKHNFLSSFWSFPNFSRFFVVFYHNIDPSSMTVNFFCLENSVACIINSEDPSPRIGFVFHNLFNKRNNVSMIAESI